jgi:tRNA-modifying protein YgfZ
MECDEGAGAATLPVDGASTGRSEGLRVSAGFCMAREFARIRRQGPSKTCGKTMLKPLTAVRRLSRLTDLGVVRVQGADAVKFLQGQVSNDVTRLSPETAVLAGLHNAQGRAIALLRLVLAGPDEVLAILPRELAGPVAARLAKFVLRAKAKVSDASPEWVIDGFEGADVAEGTARARVSAARWLVISPVSAETSAPADASEREHWRALDIAGGVPQVYAATSEAFVAQMLNLDVVDGIAFDKGCYTGQEVIARAHYRGKVKRRLQRFVTQAPARLAAGDSGTLRDGRSFKVVDAVQTADGRCEFLAVAPLAAGDDDAANAAAGTMPGAEGSAAMEKIEVRQLPLPYALPA